jgi:hypothetical protein
MIPDTSGAVPVLEILSVPKGRFAMKLLRPLCLFTVAMGLVIAIGDVSVSAQDAKKEKKKDKKKLVQPAQPEAKPAAEAKIAPKPLPPLGPVGPKDATALAKIIDDAIAKKLAEAKVSPSPLATDEEFLRRVYLDLTGVIPTSEKARSFLESKETNKRAKLIDELLESPNFGRHLADMWQAKLLPRDSNNRFVLREPFIKWLETEFNKNTPWNEFVSKLVSASGTVEENPAVTYFLANRSVDKLTDGVSQSFLGVQLQCAQCHNHPFTDWKQTEYWGMAEFFSKVKADRPQNGNKGGDNTKIGVTEGNQRSRQKDFFPEAAKTVPAKFLSGVEPKLGNGEYRPVLAKWMTDERNPFFSKAIVNRTWAQLFGTGFINPIDDMHDGNLPSHPELFETLARTFNGNGYDLKNLYRAICNSQTYQRTSKPFNGNQTDDQHFSHMTVKVLSPEQLYDSLATITGGDKAGPKVKGADNPKRGPVGPRDQFVQFFLAGAETSNATEYEAGIPQALRLMNSRVVNNPNLIRQFANPSDKPEIVFEKIYLAALSRKPTADEVKRLNTYVEKAATKAEAYADILWVVMNSSEFTMIK